MGSNQQSGSGAQSSAKSSPAAELTRQAQATAEQLKEKARGGVEAGKSAAAQQGEALASAVGRAAEQLQESNQTLADYAHGLSRGIADAAQKLRNRSVDEFLADAHALARNNPTLFILGSVGAGIALSRFVKASRSRTGNPATAVSR